MNSAEHRSPEGNSRMLETRRQRLSPWVTLVERDILVGDAVETFHALDQADYVNVLALTEDGRIPLVRQYRATVGRETLELPGGLVDEGESPAQSAARELHEETGCRASGDLHLLGSATPDVGRLDNRLWCYLATGATIDPAWQPEPGVSLEWLTPSELRASISAGRFCNGTGLSLLALVAFGDGVPSSVPALLLGPQR